MSSRGKVSFFSFSYAEIEKDRGDRIRKGGGGGLRVDRVSLIRLTRGNLGSHWRKADLGYAK